MYQDASDAALPPTDTGFARPDVAAAVQRPLGLTWRHVATGVLLLLTLPVFALAAVACLPVVLVVAGGQGLSQVWARSHTRHPARDATRAALLG